MGERAAQWIRVSSGGQDEASQVPDIARHCDSRGYEPGPVYTLHDVSASKGEQDAYAGQVLADAAAGRLDVLVAWHVDRLDRRGVWATGDMVRRLNAAGVRVETTDNGGQVISDRDLNGLVRMWSAREESEHKAERVRIAFDAIDAAGAWRGKPPWGFTAQGADRSKRLVPADEAREYVPEIFRRVIAGRSLAQVCRWLEAEGVAPAGIAGEREDGRGKSGQWWPRSLGQLVRNPAYMGRAVVSAKTQQTHMLAAEDTLVDAGTWTRAGKALDKREHRGPILAENRCELSGATRCAGCGGPLYRITGGRGEVRTAYLRCSGTGPARKSCGAPMIPLETAVALAERVLGGLLAPVYAFTEVPGNEAEIAARLAGLDYERRQVALRGLSWADEDAERARIRAEYELAESAERIPAERRAVDTGVTYGQRWQKMGTDERAAWLRSGEVTVAFVRGETDQADGELDGVRIVLAWAGDEVEPTA